MARRRLNSLHPERLGLRNIISIGAGAFHSFAINEKGEVYGWGNNLFGQLGVADEDIKPSWEKGVVEQPTKIRALNPENHGGAKVKLISAGENHSLFLFDNGALFSCGKIVNHELGIGADHPAMTDEAKEDQFIGEPVQVSFYLGTYRDDADMMLNKPMCAGLFPSSVDPGRQDPQGRAL